MTDLLNGPLSKAWKKIGIKSHHGIAAPLSALRTEKSCGIGEYLDLLLFIDFCKKVDMDIIQLLPINDSGHDPSPYNGCSSCALHPIYLSLHSLPYLDEYPELASELQQFKFLNNTPRVEYAQVLEKKIAWLFKYFEKTGVAFAKDPQFQSFVKQNPWVESYALFKILKETYNGEPWQEWPQEIKHPDREEYQFLIKEKWEELCFHIVLQYLCFEEFKQVKQYAEKQGILVLGDIPILISRDSADVWRDQDLFELEWEAGAPPDMYIADGQNWGFPLYNWEEMRKKNYHLWKQRLSCAEKLFDLYRIDHIVGFFRIWSIPKGHPASDGQFIPEDENEWGLHGKKLLMMIIESAPNTLPIGEDLGTIPDITHETLRDLTICGTKVIRWERFWKENKEFIPIEKYPPISLTTVSTHDSETLAQWWKNETDEAKAYASLKHWQYTPNLTQQQRKSILWDSHHTPSYFHVSPLQEYLAYFPELVSINPDNERINVPGKLLKTNWTYRFRPSLEQLLDHPYLIQFMKAIHA